MSIHTLITCPNCQRSDCRKSKWQSEAERHLHPGRRPYRCRNCSHRFHAPDAKDASPRIATIIATLFIAVTVVALVAFERRSALEDAPVNNTAAIATPIAPYTRRAANEGDADAQLKVAKTLLQAPSPDREESAEAVRLLQSAAEKNNTAAMVQLGKLYRSGFGVLQDFAKAAALIQQAAAQGDADGMLELGRLHRDGVGFPRDPVIAYVWLNRAAAALNAEAVRDREVVARGLTPEQMKEAQARSLVPENSPKTGATRQ